MERSRARHVAQAEPAPAARTTAGRIGRRIAGVLIAIIAVALVAIVVAVVFILLVSPVGVIAASVIAILVGFVAAFVANRLRRRIVGARRERFPVYATVVSAVLASILVAVCWIPGPSYESTGSVVPHAALVPEQVPVHTGDTVAVYHYAPASPDPTLAPILYISGGPGGAPTVEVHDFMQRFTDLGYDVYLYDPIGTYESPAPASTASYSIADEVGVVGDLVDHYGLAPVTLVAHSYGGVVAPRYIDEHPDRVGAYVALDTSPVYSLSQGNAPGEEGPPASADDSAAPVTAADAEPGQEGTTQQLGLTEGRHLIRFLSSMAVMKLLGLDHLPWGSESEFDYLFTSTDDPPVDGKLDERLNAVANTLINESLEHSPDVTQHLRTITTPPVLVIHPENGIVAWSSHLELRDIFTDVTFVPAPGQDHHVWSTPEGQDLVLRDADAFLRGQPVPDAYTGDADPFAG